MKRALLLAVALSIPILTVSAIGPFRVAGTTNEGGLRVRSGPGLDAGVVGSLAVDTDLEILDMTDEKVAISSMSARWYHFRNKWNDEEIEGWAYGFFIDVDLDNLLAKAIWLGRPGLVRDLIGEGADVNAPLIEEGKNFNQYDEYTHGSTPLVEAVKAANEEIVGILLSSGAVPDTEYSNHEIGGSSTSSALIYAVKLGNRGIVELLLDAGADLEIVKDSRGGGGDWYGFTPLTTAVMGGDPSMVEFLLGAGSEVNHTLNYRYILHGEMLKTALDIALDEGLMNIAYMIQEHGGKMAKEL
jgi:hypothetical protein